MAQRKPTIPENELLDLIRNPSKAQGLARNHIRQRTWRGFFSLTAFKGRFSFFTEKIKVSGKKTPLDLKGINKILYFFIGIFLVYLVGYFTFFMRSLTHLPTFAPINPRVSEETPEEMGAAKKISDYLDKSRARDIFKFDDSAAASTKEAPPPLEDVSVPTEKNSLSHLSLVGISFSDTPDVMIKDAKNQAVHFLKRGELIDGDIKVEAILRDRVILSYQGKEFELK